MEQIDDSILLRQYAEHQSGDAFAALVARHVNLVYSVALRQTGDPHQAEEITQAVFIVLARKAERLGEVKSLSGWLFQTTRLTANSFVRNESRRRCREQEAYVQSILNEPGHEVWPKIAPLLDAAVEGLGEKDRHAIVLRFYEGRNIREVGQALGASEAAAEKRVARAVEKLQKFFLKRGISSTTATLAASISSYSVQAAPMALAKSVTAAVLAKGALAGGSTFTLTKATLFTMKTKTVVATIATTLVLGTGAYVVTQAIPRSRVVAGKVAPVLLANDIFQPNTDSRYVVDIDPDNRRTPDSAPSGHIKSVVGPILSGPADYLASAIGTNRPLWAGRYTHYDVTNGSSLLGQHIRISGWMKIKNVQNWAGANLFIMNKDGYIFAADNMTDRPLHGTADWQQIEFITDVPKEPCVIHLAPKLYGTGEVWCDDFRIEAAPSDTPDNDDRDWHVWSTTPTDYSETTDEASPHDGHSSICLAYTRPGKAPHGSWMWWGQCNRTPGKFKGHNVRMTVWTKSEKISGRVRPNLRPKGPNGKLLAEDSQVDNVAIRGNTDWTQHVITCRVPKETQCLDTGFAFFGSGKVWIDMESIKYEITD